MFFEQFSGYFVNSYLQDDTVSTSVTLQVQDEASYASTSYIGNQTLPTGVNPFLPPPAEKNLLWVWILIGIVIAAILGGMVFYIFCRKSANKNVVVKTSDNGETEAMIDF